MPRIVANVLLIAISLHWKTNRSQSVLVGKSFSTEFKSDW